MTSNSKRLFISITILTGICLTVLTTTTSCTKDAGFDPKPGVPGIDTSKLADVQYNRDIKPILTTYCLGTNGQGCHIANTTTFASGEFETYEGLKEKADNGTLESRVFTDGGGMPPSYSTSPQTLTPTDLAVFKKWVAIGAPNN